MRLRLVAFLILAMLSTSLLDQNKQPLRIGVAGLTHTHVHWIFSSVKNGDIEIAGIAEPNRELAFFQKRPRNLLPQRPHHCQRPEQPKLPISGEKQRNSHQPS